MNSKKNVIKIWIFYKNQYKTKIYKSYKINCKNKMNKLSKFKMNL